MPRLVPRVVPWRSAWLLLAAAWLVLMLAGCSPAMNWRVARLDGAPVQALMPCKPERAEREVAMLGPDAPPATLRMMSCDSAGLTFAVSAVRLPDAATPPDSALLMDRWQLATWASLRQSPAPAAAEATPATPPTQPTQPPAGWAPQSQPVRGAEQLRGWQGPGVAYDGRALQARFVLAQRSGWLMQAAIYGPEWPAETSETFFGGLALE
jgi:hypothetical protein